MSDLDETVTRAGVTHAPLDLGEVLDAHPAREVILDLGRVTTSTLTLGEVADMAEVLDLELDAVVPVVQGKHGQVAAARALLALAWVIARRGDPDLAWAEARTWRVEVRNGTRPDPTKRPRPTSERRR
jgi:hypothetical protein